MEACLSEVSFDPAGRRSEIAMRATFGVLRLGDVCLMTGWGQGEPESSRMRRVKGVLAIVLARDRSESLGAIE